MESRPPEPPKEPGSGLPKWFNVGVMVLGVTAGVIILVDGACFLIWTSLALG